MSTPDLILHHGLFTTLDRGNPTASAVAIKDGVFVAVGHDSEVMKLAGSSTRVIDLKGKRVLPGLIDNHLHIIRGGLNFNLELRWDGVRSLADAMSMLRRQVEITPAPQWVRVVGGFTEHQFAEKRLPTIDELNDVAPDTPVFLLHLYDRAILNGAALRAVGYTKNTPEPPGGEITRDANDNPTGLLLAIGRRQAQNGQQRLLPHRHRQQARGRESEVAGSIANRETPPWGAGSCRHPVQR